MALAGLRRHKRVLLFLLLALIVVAYAYGANPSGDGSLLEPTFTPLQVLGMLSVVGFLVLYARKKRRSRK